MLLAFPDSIKKFNFVSNDQYQFLASKEVSQFPSEILLNQKTNRSIKIQTKTTNEHPNAINYHQTSKR
jgi:hypothetical protein